MSSIMTSIKQVDGGSVIKSGDTSSVFKFEILDSVCDHRLIQLTAYQVTPKTQNESVGRRS